MNRTNPHFRMVTRNKPNQLLKNDDEPTKILLKKWFGSMNHQISFRANRFWMKPTHIEQNRFRTEPTPILNLWTESKTDSNSKKEYGSVQWIIKLFIKSNRLWTEPTPIFDELNPKQSKIIKNMFRFNESWN